MINLQKYGTESGFRTRNPGSAVRHVIDCATRPGLDLVYIIHFIVYCLLVDNKDLISSVQCSELFIQTDYFFMLRHLDRMYGVLFGVSDLDMF